MSLFNHPIALSQAEVLTDTGDQVNSMQMREAIGRDNMECIGKEMFQNISEKDNLQSNSVTLEISESFDDIIDDDNQPVDKLSDDEFLTEEDLNFPPMISMQGKHAGSTRYVLAGYIYTRDGYSQTFRCSERGRYQCSGRVLLKDKKVYKTKQHSHPKKLHILPIEQAKQQMLLRARLERSVELRAIYLEACETEPLVALHLDWKTMLNKMKKVRRNDPVLSSISPNETVKKVNFDTEFAKDWLEIPYGQNEVARCKICEKDIVPLTKVQVYDHYLSKIHGRAIGEHNQSTEKKFQLEKQNADKGQENKRHINVPLQENLKNMKTSKTSKKKKNYDQSSFCERVMNLPIGHRHLERGENDHRTLIDGEARSVPAIDPHEGNNETPKISVDVYDSNTGCMTTGLEISLHVLKDDLWCFIGIIKTDECGKCCVLSNEQGLDIGFYKLNLDTRSYYSLRNQRCFYPYIEIVFDVQSPNEFCNFYVQLSPFSYTCTLSNSESLKSRA